MTNTLTVNTTITLSYSGLTLASASKTSQATCLATTGAKFEDLPTLTATAPTNFYSSLGSVSKLKQFWLYIENYDTAVDAVLLLADFALTVDALGIAYSASAVEYLVNDLVYHSGTDGWYRCIQVNGTGSAVKTPGTDTLYWTPLNKVKVPFGRAVLLNTQGGFWLIAESAPTAGVKVLCVQDEA